MTHSNAYQQAQNLIDADFEALDCMGKQDLWEYLTGNIPGLIREESDKLWNTIFKVM